MTQIEMTLEKTKTEPPKPGSTYDRILAVIKQAGRPLAPHEFSEINITNHTEHLDYEIQARAFVGCTEATLGRRMREMATKGWLLRVTVTSGGGTSLRAYQIA